MIRFPNLSGQEHLYIEPDPYKLFHNPLAHPLMAVTAVISLPLGLGKGTVSGLWKTVEILTSHMWLRQSNLHLDQPITKRWCQSQGWGENYSGTPLAQNGKHKYTKNIVLEYYSSTDFPVLLLVCSCPSPGQSILEAMFHTGNPYATRLGLCNSLAKGSLCRIACVNFLIFKSLVGNHVFAVFEL